MTDDDWFISADVLAAQAIADHHPRAVLEDYENEDPFHTLWETGPGILIMACGCEVDVKPGDTVWFVAAPNDPNKLWPIAIEPGTIH